ERRLIDPAVGGQGAIVIDGEYQVTHRRLSRSFAGRPGRGKALILNLDDDSGTSPNDRVQRPSRRLRFILSGNPRATNLICGERLTTSPSARHGCARAAPGRPDLIPREEEVKTRLSSTAWDAEQDSFLGATKNPRPCRGFCISEDDGARTRNLRRDRPVL